MKFGRLHANQRMYVDIERAVKQYSVKFKIF